MTSSNASANAVRLSTCVCASRRPLENACSVSTRWQKAWMVEIGATSRPRIAASRRSRAAVSIVQVCGASASSVDDSWRRTRLISARMRRTSSAAARSVNVTTSISSMRASPRTRRSTTRCSMRYVLPVPADASITAARSRGSAASSAGKG